MLKIGLTGGIGSGKTTVAKVFMQFGVPVFFADDESKLLFNDLKVIEKIKNIFGDEIIFENKINKKKIAELVFSDTNKLNKLNSILHPLVAERYNTWILKNLNNKFTIKEAAILFESGSYIDCYKIICVSAELKTRINRVTMRDSVDTEKVMERINNQWSEEQRLEKSDFIIYNNDGDLVVPQVLKIIEALSI